MARTDPLLLGVDVGTGGSRALLVAPDGTVAASAVTEHALRAPRPQWSEQDPDEWWSATCASVRRATADAGIDPARIAAVGLTGQMHSLVLTGADDAPLRPAILWNDQRTEVECDAIHAAIGVDRAVALTGRPVLTGFTAPKVLWVREHEPDVFARATRMHVGKDYVRFRLTGDAATDVADASGTSLFDTGARRWSEEIVAALALDSRLLPRVYESPEVTGAVSAAGAAATGLRPGTPVVAGAGDQAAQALGCGIVDDGAVSITIGTSGVVFAASDAYAPDPGGRLHAFCHARPGRWHHMGVMLSAGGSLRWYRDTLGGGATYDALIAAAATVPPGAEGLLFLPYLTGERTPHADPSARGAFVGLTLRHGPAHLTRAVLEGITFGLLDGVRLVRERGVPARRIRVSGGGARSAVWRQMLADVLGAEIVTVRAEHGAAFGAALLAGTGAGVFPTVEAAVAATVREAGTTAPGADAGAYAESAARYRALYPALAPAFRAAAE